VWYQSGAICTSIKKSAQVSSIEIVLDFVSDWKKQSDFCKIKWRGAPTASGVTTDPSVCKDKDGKPQNPCPGSGANYLITAVSMTYPFVPDVTKNYARGKSACNVFELLVHQRTRKWNAVAKQFEYKYVWARPVLDKTQSSAPAKATQADALKGNRESDIWTPIKPMTANAVKFVCSDLPFYALVDFLLDPRVVAADEDDGVRRQEPDFGLRF